MPRNGAGVFSLVNNTWFPAVNGVLATATDWTPFITDIQNAITQSVSSDGQTPMTGNLPMGNNKITGLANGTAATDAAAFGQIPHYVGQCRLTKSGSNLLLIPLNGNQLVINGTLQVVPAAGVSLAPGAFVAGTTYFIYAYMVGAVVTLEGSTTGHSTDVTTGVEIKTGDATRTLVGMARPIAGPLWQDTADNRFVISWFNRRPINTSASFSVPRATASGPFTEINAEIRNQFLAWSDSALAFWAVGSTSNSTAGIVKNSTALGLDSALPVEGISEAAMPAGINNQVLPIACQSALVMAEGYHFVTLLGAVTGGTGTWAGGAVGARCSVQGVIQG